MRSVKIQLFFVMAFIGSINVSCSSNSNSAVIPADTLVFADTITVGELVSPCVVGNAIVGTDSLILEWRIDYSLDPNYPDSCRRDTTIIAIALPEGTVFRIYGYNNNFIYYPHDSRFTNTEYLSPYPLRSLNHGDNLQYRFDSLSYVIYDSFMNVRNEINRNSLVIPYIIRPGLDSVAVINEIGSDFREYHYLGYRIFSINLYTGQEIAVYRDDFSSEVEFQYDPELDITDSYSVFTTDVDGNVYISDYSSDEYVIHVYDCQGEEINSIEIDSTPRRQEFDETEFWLPEGPFSFFYIRGERAVLCIKLDYPEYHPYVTKLEVLEDEIWARRYGTRNSETWDVISMNGDLIRRVVLYAPESEIATCPMLVFNGSSYFAIYREDSCDRYFTVRNLAD